MDRNQPGIRVGCFVICSCRGRNRDDIVQIEVGGIVRTGIVVGKTIPGCGNEENSLVPSCGNRFPQALTETARTTPTGIYDVSPLVYRVIDALNGIAAEPFPRRT